MGFLGDAVRKALTPAEELEFQNRLRREQRLAEARYAPKRAMDEQALAQKQAAQADRERQVAETAQRRAAEAAQAEAQRRGAEHEKLIHQPLTEYTGGNRSERRPLVVWHWRAVLPASIRTVINAPAGFGPAFILAAAKDGEKPKAIEARKSLVKRFPALRSDAEASAWARSMKVVEADIKKRYPLLKKLRDETWWTRVCEAAKLTDTSSEDRPWRGHYASGTQRITTIDAPTITGIRITREEGLTIRIKGRVGDSAERWSRALPVLRAAFQEHCDAANLRVTMPKTGGFVLRLDDVETAFPKCVPLPDITAIESVADAAARYPKTVWPVGVTASGKWVHPSVKEVYHVLVSGGTGSGKSVYVASLMTYFALQGFQIFLSDPKREFPTLEGTPGMVMRSTSAGEHCVLVAEVLARLLEREETVEREKAAGNPDPAASFPGLLLMLDEFVTLRATDIKPAFGDTEGYDLALETIIRRGRAARIHVVIANQDIYADSIPMPWQNNFQLLVALGEARGRTLKSEFVPPQLQDDAMRLAGRITRATPGRGVYVDRVGDRVLQVQSPWGYSEGTTDIANAPELVKDSWVAQRDTMAAMPRMYPRLGIEANGPAWDRSGMDAVMKTPTIPLENADGVIESRSKFDPRSDDFIGKAKVKLGRRASASTIEDVQEKPESPAEPEEAADDEASSPPQRNGKPKRNTESVEGDM